jgi:DNA replication protein DnaC
VTDAYLIDEIYKERILENQRILDKRVNDTYDKYPLLKELDNEISSKIIADTLKKIGASAASSDGASLEELKAKRLSYLKEIGIDDNYLTSYYHCDKCRDTGYLEDGTLCTCFIKLKAELMIKRSPISDRIGKDTFSYF